MAELTPLTALQAEVAEVSGILKDNMGKVKIMANWDGWEGQRWTMGGFVS